MKGISALTGLKSSFLFAFLILIFSEDQTGIAKLIPPL